MRENHAEPLQKLCLLIIFEGLIEKFVKNLPNPTYSAILLLFGSKNSSQDGQFFKTIPANFGGNKEKYLPLPLPTNQLNLFTCIIPITPFQRTLQGSQDD